MIVRGFLIFQVLHNLWLDSQWESTITKLELLFMFSPYLYKFLREMSALEMTSPVRKDKSSFNYLHITANAS